MYSPGQLRRGLRRAVENPRFLALECNRLYHRRCYRRSYNPSGVDVVAADWDNLLLLDACRYDDFAAVADLPGTLERRQSRGAHTVEFLEANFGGRDLLDTVYVTASPQLYRWRDRIDAAFHDVVNVWRDGWDDEHDTVLPGTVAEWALDAAERYPDKRLIVHFVQPHYPFVGWDLTAGGLHPDDDDPDVWARLRCGDLDLDPDVLREAYRDNLELALPAVERLLAELRGRTVVSADHGNMFGERAAPLPVREWGHPPGLYTEKLVAVPWHVVEAETRKRIRAGDAAAGTDVDEAVVEERLRELGYAE